MVLSLRAPVSPGDVSASASDVSADVRDLSAVVAGAASSRKAVPATDEPQTYGRMASMIRDQFSAPYPRERAQE